MRISIVGSGPAGTTAALLLARAGHDITLIDRDPGPRPGEEWERVGVMQFHLPHTFRAPGRNLLLQRLPDLHQALVDAGAEVSAPPGAPGFAANMHIRRQLLDRVMWEFASREPRVTRVGGHADGVVVDGEQTTGIVVDGRPSFADLVIDASGKAGRFATAYRPDAEGGDCGLAYASRLFQLRPGAEPGPRNGGPGWFAEYDRFLNLVFVHDAGTFSVLLVRLLKDDGLAVLRDQDAFMAAVGQLPGAADWVDPARSVPIDKVRAGAGLVNLYRPQAHVHGLLAIGDATCTTNPTGARGVSLGMLAAAALTDIVAESAPDEWTARLDAWSLAQLRPWFEDHLVFDAAMRARWSGEPIDTDAGVSWDLVAAAAGQRPDFMPTLGPFLGMMALPTSIDPLREIVRGMVRDGWRPPAPHGPKRADVVAAISGGTALAAT